MVSKPIFPEIPPGRRAERQNVFLPPIGQVVQAFFSWTRKTRDLVLSKTSTRQIPLRKAVRGIPVPQFELFSFEPFPESVWGSSVN
jgi:hypothetical protein